jgi:uncharacterized protein YjdB
MPFTPVDLNSVTLTMTLTVSQVKQVQVQLISTQGKVIPPGSTVSWATSDITKVSIANQLNLMAELTGVALGTAVITVTDGTTGSQATITVNVIPTVTPTVVLDHMVIGEIPTADADI